MLCKRTGHLFCCNIAGWSSLEARRAHNPKVTGSNPVPATIDYILRNMVYFSIQGNILVATVVYKMIEDRE